MFHKAAAAAELIGMYMLIFVGVGYGFINQRGDIDIAIVSAAWATACVAVKYSFTHISGAHLNPAVTVAFFVTRCFPLKQTAAYVAAQVAGGVAACLALRWLFVGYDPMIMVTIPSDDETDVHVFVWEAIITFNLVFVGCCATSGSDIDRPVWAFHGLASGATYFFNILISGRVGGVSMKLARSIGPAVATRYFHKLWIYMLSPVVGTTMASASYNLFQQTRDRDDDDDERFFLKINKAMLEATTNKQQQQDDLQDDDETSCVVGKAGILTSLMSKVMLKAKRMIFRNNGGPEILNKLRNTLEVDNHNRNNRGVHNMVDKLKKIACVSS